MPKVEITTSLAAPPPIKAILVCQSKPAGAVIGSTKVTTRPAKERRRTSKDLYASRPRVFQKAILPQTIYGLQAGVVITFVPAMAMFVVTDILGGAKYMLIGNLIQLQFSQTRDWPFGAALRLALTLLTLLSFLFFRVSRFSRKAA
jgi:ABC-type spermidine/putrescine transport system permease subunit I